MSKPIRQRPQAATDIAAIANFLFGHSPRAARSFIDAVEAAYALLSTHPASGSTRHAPLLPELPAPLRFYALPPSGRTLVYYIELPDAVEVIRVWDAARGLEALMQETIETPHA